MGIAIVFIQWFIRPVPFLKKRPRKKSVGVLC